MILDFIQIHILGLVPITEVSVETVDVETSSSLNGTGNIDSLIKGLTGYVRSSWTDYFGSGFLSEHIWGSLPGQKSTNLGGGGNVNL